MGTGLTDSKTSVIFRIRRYDPESGQPGYFQEFRVPWQRGNTVLDGLLYIKENLDGTLAFRSSCRMYVCGSCGMLINDYPNLACHSQIADFGAPVLTLKPLLNFPVIKDLVPDLGRFFASHRSVKPFIIRKDTDEMENPTDEFVQCQSALNQILQFACCVKCGICLSACPTMATDRTFLGPQALAQAYRCCGDNRDDGAAERLGVAAAGDGVWGCHLAGACSESCPKGVDPALGIQLLKRRAAAAALKLRRKAVPASVAPAPHQQKTPIPFPPFNVSAP